MISAFLPLLLSTVEYVPIVFLSFWNLFENPPSPLFQGGASDFAKNISVTILPEFRLNVNVVGSAQNVENVQTIENVENAHGLDVFDDFDDLDVIPLFIVDKPFAA